MSRDYQIILDMAREEECDWVWNIDIDEEIVLGKYNRDAVLHFFLNCEFNSIGFPIFEMRNDENHFVMVYDTDKEMKEGRLVHKCYKVLSHFEFDKKDKHGQSIPHNCERAKKFVPLPIKHYGHMLKKQRDDKRKIYEGNKFKDMSELNATWMKEEGEDVIVKEFDEIVYKFQEGNWK